MLLLLKGRSYLFLALSFLVFIFPTGCSEDESPTGIDENSNYETSHIVINEINYNSSDDFNPGDWVELHNADESPVELSGWIFKDEDDSHIFILPDNTIITSNGYLVLCNDAAAFSHLFPDVSNYIGDFNFGLSGQGELIRLFDAQGELIDWVYYDDSAPWPEEPDGNGSTLALLNPARNNELLKNWAASLGHGTPGTINDVYTE